MATISLEQARTGRQHTGYGFEHECILCGEEIHKDNLKWYVHMTTDGELTDDRTLTQENGSQGFMEIGSGCRKKLPSEFVFDFSE